MFQKQGIVSKNSFAISACDAFAIMDFLMSLQISHLRKSSIAHIAYKRFLSCMCANMFSKDSGASKKAATIFTLVGLHSRMLQLLVVKQLPRGRKMQIAKFAPVQLVCFIGRCFSPWLQMSRNMVVLLFLWGCKSKKAALSGGYRYGLFIALSDSLSAGVIRSDVN